MLTKIRRYIERHRLLSPGDSILAACSGGPDSLALVDILYRLREECGITLAVAHVDHMFRGAESEADADFVARFCGDLGLRLYRTAIDVPAFIADSGLSVQDAARILRYRYLRGVAAESGAKIATGHHLDDQAETILLNFLRGAGSKGLAGMKAFSGGIIRPLLEIPRMDIEAYCSQQGLEPRTDSSNLKPDYSRNFLRLELMPVLRERFNANLADTLCRTGSIIGDEHDYIRRQAGAAYAAAVAERDGVLEVDCGMVNSLHIALRREIFRQIIEKKREGLRGISFLHVEKLLELAAFGSVGSILELPGNLIARKDYRHIRFQPPAETAFRGLPPPGVRLSIPGVTNVPSLGMAIVAKLVDSIPKQDDPGSAFFNLDQLELPLYVRTRQEGDRFKAAGAPGSKKLKKFFIDAKISRQQRDFIPIIYDRQGIVWVGGYRQADRARAVKGAGRYLQLIITAGGTTVD